MARKKLQACGVPGFFCTLLLAATTSCKDPAIDLSRRSIIIQIPYTVGIYSDDCGASCAKRKQPNESLHFCEMLHGGTSSFTNTDWSWAICSFEDDD